VLAGNSIGGFISASAAADYPSLVAGLALLNSAGVWGHLVGTGWGQPFQSKAKQTCSPQDNCYVIGEETWEEACSAQAASAAEPTSTAQMST
jgi:pimeloyl-ACP methyl ester carboxylesterase